MFMSQRDQNFERRLFLRRLLGVSGAAAVTFVSPMAFASSRVEVKGVRMSQDGRSTRVVFDLSGPVEHNLFTLSKPERVVIDFRNTNAPRGLHVKPIALVHDIRYARRNVSNLRVVLDLKEQTNTSSFLLKPGKGSTHYRLVVDLAAATADSAAPVITAAAAQTGKKLRDVVVAIDPGHGGVDPGAIGKRGTYEKHVVLQIARRLEALIKKTPGMRPYLIRSSDHYVSLRERLRKARAKQADLFISIHADASPYRYPKGSTVYVLSEHGASSEAARLLAKRQNDVDRVAGVNLSDKDNLVASVLVDLAQTATRESSFKLGEHLTHNINKVIRLHSRTVERAAFVVLKSPDIPSALVETAFISNPSEERQLRTPAFQRRMAIALHEGVQDYFSKYAPPGTLLAAHNQAKEAFS
jgi:N-acetylmuramoyl-L-alanine amidase